MKHILLIIIFITLSFAACTQSGGEQEVDKDYWRDVYAEVAGLQITNELNEAVAVCTAAMEKDPKKVPYYLNLRGVVYEDMGKQQEAIEDFKEAAKLGNDLAQEYLKKKGIEW